MQFEKEITVQILDDYNTLHSSLLKEGFKIVDEYILKDIYMLKKEVDINSAPILDLLNEGILIRDVVDITKLIVYKYKEFNETGEITKQSKTKCKIYDIDEAVNLFNIVGYKELIQINDKCISYSNDEVELVVQLVNDKYIFIEMEEKSEFTNQDFKTEKEMIKALENININYDKTNYYVKKAELVFQDKYKS